MERPFSTRSKLRDAARMLELVAWLGAAPASLVLSAAAPALAAPAAQGDSGTLVTDPARLPDKVAAMRAAILAAARTGDIETLRTPLEWNEIKPEFSATPSGDPIAYWKSVSTDGQGRQILAVLLEILETPPARIGAGTPAERYVWPGFAEVDLAALPPPLEVMLYRLVSPAEVATMRAAKTWSWWRLSIGADGTWHSFLRGN